MSSIYEQLQNLSAEKRALLEMRVRKQQADNFLNREPSRIARQKYAETYPLSFAQQRLWFLEQLVPSSSIYNLPILMRLTGDLDVEALEHAIDQVIQRHDVLRTTFAQHNGEPLQIIHSHRPQLLLQLDFSGWAVDDREAEVHRRVLQETQDPFDLVEGPLLRAILLKLDKQSHLLLLVMHHIISDGWSLSIFMHELGVFYRSIIENQVPTLPELPIQYADYAVWQRQWAQGKELERQLSYWKKQLARVSQALDLCADKPRPPVQSFSGAQRSIQLSTTLTKNLKELSHREGTTLFMTLLAAFQLLLHRYTGQCDIVIGSPVAGRTRAETERVIGFFVNTLVLRGDLRGDPSFRELLGQVRRVALEAYDHQDLPFERLVEELQPVRDLSRMPLVQVFFSLQNAPTETLNLPGVTFQSLEVEYKTTKSDLGLFMVETDHRLSGSLSYSTDLFEAATVDRLLVHFRILLEELIAEPNRRLSEISLLTSTERQRLLREAKIEVDAASQKYCIHQLFEAQVLITPNAVAADYKGELLTYRELNRRANQLAYHLRRLGVGTESCVGICMKRSLDLLVGLLGIMKAGGAYVPLDPAYPRERLAFMLADTGAAVLLTQECLLEQLPVHSARTICLDAEWATIAKEQDENLIGDTYHNNVAYVVYTSGSTGTPKGIMVCHDALVNLVAWYHAAYGVNSFDRCAQVVGLSFDVAVCDIWSCLTAGACLCLAPDEETRLMPVKLLGWLAEQAVTLAFIATPLAELLLREEMPSTLALRFLLMGGSKLGTVPDKQFPFILTDNYGPAEAAVFTTWTQVKSKTTHIGQAIPKTEVYILDMYGQPVPMKIPGEIYIGGAGLARGYLNNSALTAERFIPHPFPGEPGERLYKTGDLARWLPDNNIEYLGRTDSQVKIRGFRVELGEIEAVLHQFPGVREAVVVSRQEELDDKRLIAYLVLDHGQLLLRGELRHFLLEKLPDYMVPAAIVPLESLPMTPNGKLDQRALPRPERSHFALQEGFVAPRDNVEIRLVQIWEDLLKIDPIGVTNDFFALGGHSMIAIRLMASVEEEFGCRLPVSVLFQTPTIEHLAEAIRRYGSGGSWSSLVCIRRGKSSKSFFFVHPAGGSIFCYVDLAYHLGSAYSIYGLQSVQTEQDLRIEDMALRYIEEIRAIDPNGPYYLGGWSLGGVVAFEMAQQLRKQGDNTALLVLLDCYLPNDKDKLQTVNSISLLAAIAAEHNVLISPRLLSSLTFEGQLQYILGSFKAAGVVTPDLSLTQLRQKWTTMRMNVDSLRDYIPQAYYSGRTALFSASEGNVQATRWNTLISSGLTVHTAPGDHYSLVREPYVRVLAEQLRVILHETTV